MLIHLRLKVTSTYGRAALRRLGIFAVSWVWLSSALFASSPAVTNVATSATNSSVVITWTTDVPSSSQVNYGVAASYGSSSVLDPLPVTTHAVTLNGLVANTLYNFDVVSSNSGNTTTSSSFRFVTLSTFPIIGDLNVIFITGNSATINWTTDQPSSTMVNYGTTTSYGSSSPYLSTPAIAHSLTLNGLTPNTTYNFATVSSAGSGAQSTSANQTFTTTSATAPNIGFPVAYGFTSSSATITWSTDVAANTVVVYGTTTALGQFTPVQSTLSNSHGVTLTGLAPGTTYYFICESTGANGATGYSYPSHFSTTDPPPVAPIISNVTTSTPTSTSATIAWTTDVPSNSLVNYGTTVSFGFSSLNPTLTRSHSVTLTGLSPGTRYDFQAVSANATGVATFGVDLNGFTIWAWGDSQTTGGKDGSNINFTNSLANDLGVPVINEGVGGETSTQIAQRMLATPAAFGPGNCNVFWVGSNNPTQVSQILSDDASMVNALATPACYLVLGDVNRLSTPLGTSTYDNIVATSKALAAAYPNNYLDIREIVVQAYNPSLPLDVADHANEVMPASLRAVVAFGNITSGALDSTSCSFSVSAGTQGVGTVIIIDSETILINSVSGGQVTGCTRGYNLTTAASHGANATYYEIDPIHLGYLGLQFVASKVAAWFQSYPWPLCGGSGMICPFPSNFTTPGTTVPGPVISSVTASSITGTSAILTWTTDQASTSLANFGTTTTYGSASTLNSTLVTNHTVTLTGLTPGTIYNFDVISANASAVSSASANASFATTAAVSTSPILSNINTTNLSPTSVTVTWTTDQPASSLVSYGTTTSYGASSGLNAALVTAHSLTLTGLTAGTLYNFNVTSTNAAAQSTTSTNNTVTTTAVNAIAPFVGYVAAWGINNSGATVTWSTDVPATAQLAYGTTTALGQFSPLQTSMTASHGVTLSGLTSGTTYTFVAQSTAANGATGYSPIMTFKTTGTAPTGPPVAPAISSVQVGGISNTTATVTWTTDQASSSMVNFGATTSYGSASPLNPTLVNSHAVTLTGLTPGTLYNFDVVSANLSALSSTSSNATFTTTSVTSTPPVISSVTTTNVTSTAFTVTWTTDQPSSSLVNFGKTISYGSSSSLDTTLVTAHSVTLTGLAAGTLYNFDVTSATVDALSTTSPNGTATTTASNATPPFVGYVAAWGINNTGATVTWSTDVPANAQLSYGTTTALGQLSPLQTAMTASHGVILTGLNPGTTYNFVAQSTAASGATGYSPVMIFKTSGTQTTPPPVISNVTATNITDTTAIVTWTTDQATSSQVNYGLTTTYTLSSTLNPTLTANHSVTLTGLTPGATYNFDVASTNSSAVSSTSTNSTFLTTGTAPAAVISNVSSSSVTSGTATITWTTDQASSSLVNYGISTGYGSTSLSSALVTTHTVTLTGLTPNTVYNYDVASTNAAGLSSTSANFTFKTSSNTGPGPVISYLNFWGVTSAEVTISWSTDAAANTAVAYGTTASLGQLSPVQTALTNSHGITLTGLSSGTKYYFVAQSAGVNGNTGYSTTYSFNTLAGPPTILSVTTTPGANNTATINWTTSVPTNSYVRYGTSAGSYGHYSVLTSLTATPSCALTYVPSGTVHYQLVSTDALGNQVTSADATFTEP